MLLKVPWCVIQWQGKEETEMEALDTLDKQVLSQFVEAKLVWPFEYNNWGTRHTLVRIANGISAALMGLAVLFSPLIETVFEQTVFFAAAVGFGLIMDRMLVKAEQEAVQEGRKSNLYRNRRNFRFLGTAAALLVLFTGLYALNVSPIETFCRIGIAFVSIAGIYVFCADPVPENWAPRPKRLNW